MTISTEIESGVATIVIDRPERRNALSAQMRLDFLAALLTSAQRDDVRVVVIRGASKAFCAGADMSEKSEASIPNGRHRIHVAHSIVKAIAHLEKPVIAAVGGDAVGIGWSIALACDFILASPSARFGQVFKKIGLAPDGGSVYLLSQYVGVLRAKELTMTGRLVGGEDAYRMGLVTELVDDENLYARTSELANELAGSAVLAMGMTKRLFLAVGGSDFDRFLEIESHIQNQLLQTSDHAEGVDAFLSKREPDFKGR